ncbi:MAG TPA: response regulator [Ktedonobacteraceae bacterium]|jgi:CheY-like chemotaxis protein|nr:response regulator [Ktedonobacteraceae bacterium]
MLNNVGVSPEEDQSKQDHKTIFVVEDNEHVSTLIAYVLRLETSYEVQLFPDAQDVLEAVKTRVPDLFLLDYMLPRTNGLDLYDELHAMESLKHVPAIMISAYWIPRQELEKRGLAFLSKPFKRLELLQAVERALEGTVVEK